MFIKPLIAALSLVLYFSPVAAVADDTKACNATQQGNCGRFCEDRGGIKSCIVDITTRSGTCTCGNGASHSK